MTIESFSDGWTFRRLEDAASIAVTLPHDAMIHEARFADGGTSHHGGFFPGGGYVYSKRWVAPAFEEGRVIRVLFEAVYGACRLRLNGEEIGRHDSGYREWAVTLDGLRPGRENVLEVEVDNTAVPNSRWYTGSGIYRNVWLEDLPGTHIADGGIRLTTTSLDGEATVEAEIQVVAPSAGLIARVRLADENGAVTEALSSIETGLAAMTLTVEAPKVWSHERPFLYLATIELLRDGVVVDKRSLKFGLRTVTIDALNGMLVNGRSVLLKGGAVHHDNGVLGAATFRDAEFRRARILKSNGFNAIRSAHQPISKDLLDAADEIGLYVIDELADTWYTAKTPHDASPQWNESWRDDARAMIAKARNHASLIMYSIGNEVGETASPRGVETAREVSAFFHAHDPHHPTTLAMNFLVNVMSSRGTDLFKVSDAPKPDAPKRKPSAGSSTVANIMMNRIGSIMQTVSKLPLADRVSRDALSEVDIAGYNYAWGRYDSDRKKYPNRVMYGSETLAGDVVKAWRRVEKSPAILGDFVWSGWDYLGETGLGTWTYGADDVLLSKAYPHILAGCGVIDIVGNPGAPALFQRAVWNDLLAPGIAVRPLDHAAQKTHRVAWRATDAIQSWAWRGSEGKQAEIEVYCTDDEVELFLNGKSLGRKPAGRRRGYVTRFRTRYAPGTLEAVGYRDGQARSRSALDSAASPSLLLVAEQDTIVADPQALAFIRIEIADEHGVVEMLADDDVTVVISGPAMLAGIGSASPTTEASFSGRSARTYYGRALAVVRSTGQAGDVVVTASSAALGTVSLTLAAVPAESPARP